MVRCIRSLLAAETECRAAWLLSAVARTVSGVVCKPRQRWADLTAMCPRRPLVRRARSFVLLCRVERHHAGDGVALCVDELLEVRLRHAGRGGGRLRWLGRQFGSRHSRQLCRPRTVAVAGVCRCSWRPLFDVARRHVLPMNAAGCWRFARLLVVYSRLYVLQTITRYLRQIFVGALYTSIDEVSSLLGSTARLQPKAKMVLSVNLPTCSPWVKNVHLRSRSWHFLACRLMTKLT